MPGHPIALALIRAAGSPIAAPSANRFMHISPTAAQHALADLYGRVPLILDGGPCEVGVESTVLDLCSTPPTILRPGGVSLEMLRTALPDVQPPRQRLSTTRSITSQEETARVSPGQMLVHYAPTVPTYLYEGLASAVQTALLTEIQYRHVHGEQVGLLVADDDAQVFQESGAQVYSLGKTPEDIARNLFAGLRSLEDAGVDVILCRGFNERGLGLAVRDRLRKAAGGKIIQCD
jgi:L-threonylcarbamoyladenylate synthase